MLWTLFALFFWWLIYNELKNPILEFLGFERPDSLPVVKGYLIILFALALTCSWFPLHSWHFQRGLTSIARKLSLNPNAIVHCNTLLDTLFDEPLGVAGHADFKTGYIVIQYPRCSLLMSYLRHPDSASMDEIISLNILTHESMHAGGEVDEAKTECKAVQRNERTAILLGVPQIIAHKNALDYYTNFYMKRNDSYFSKECAVGKELDEHLDDSIWIAPF